MVLFFIVEGGIGIGKSTLVKKLCEITLKLGITSTYELQPINKWTLLGEYYSVKKDKSLEKKDPKALEIVVALQKQVIESYATIYRKYKNDKTLDIVFLEACAITSMESFGRLLLDAQELSKEDFNELLSIAKESSPTPSAIVYLYIGEDDVSIQKKRIEFRGRDIENGIPEDYLKNLNKKFKNLYDSHELGNRWVNSFYLDTKNESPESASLLIINHFNIFHNWTSSKQNITIEGCLGTGKTTLGKYLNENSNLPMRFYEQRLTENIIKQLEEKYNNPNETSIFNLQKAFVDEYEKTFHQSNSDMECREFFHKNFEIFSKHHTINVFEAVFSITEVFTKHHYELGELSEDLYEYLKEDEEKKLSKMKDSIKMIVHLKGPVKEVMCRIKNRGRECERTVEKEFVASISSKYDSLIRRLNLNSDCVIDKSRPKMNIFNFEIGSDVTLEHLKEEIDKTYRQYYFCN